MKKKISSFNCSLSKDVILNSNKILKKGCLIDGNEVNKFENKLSKYFNNKNILAVSDLSSALYLILKNLNLKKNDEVISMSYNCLSSTAPILKAGLKPLWCDIEEDYPEINLKHCQKLISNKTKVLILYYMGGYVQNSLAVKKFCQKNNLIFIEDVNCALGSKFKKKKLGCFGDYSVFSFYPNRILSSINGGAILFPNSLKLKNFRKEINYGIKKKNENSKNLVSNSNINKIGFFNKFLNLSASIANKNFDKLNSRISLIKKNINFYDSNINNQHIEKIQNKKNYEVVPWVYFLKSKKSNKIINYLNRNNIESNKLHYIVHKYKGFYKYSKKNNLKNTETFYKNLFTIPCGWWLKESDTIKIVRLLNKFNF